MTRFFTYTAIGLLTVLLGASLSVTKAAADSRQNHNISAIR